MSIYLNVQFKQKHPNIFTPFTFIDSYISYYVDIHSQSKIEHDLLVTNCYVFFDKIKLDEGKVSNEMTTMQCPPLCPG